MCGGKSKGCLLCVPGYQTSDWARDVEFPCPAYSMAREVTPTTPIWQESVPTSLFQTISHLQLTNYRLLAVIADNYKLGHIRTSHYGTSRWSSISFLVSITSLTFTFFLSSRWFGIATASTTHQTACTFAFCGNPYYLLLTN